MSSFFPFNAEGVVYQSGVDVLAATAEAALRALQERARAKRAELEAHRAAGVFEGECDDEGLVIWDRADLLAEEIANIAEMGNELRKAFVTAAYHHWEVSVVRWARWRTPDKANLANHGQLRAKAIEVGYPPDPDLDRVRCLANLIKHDSDPARSALKAAAPGLYADLFENVTARPHWASAIEISDPTLDWVLDVVRRSGPGPHTLTRTPTSAPAAVPPAV